MGTAPGMMSSAMTRAACSSAIFASKASSWAMVSLVFGAVPEAPSVAAAEPRIWKAMAAGLRLGGGDFAGDAQFPAFDEFRYGWMVFDVLVQLRHERALAIPFVRADDVHARAWNALAVRTMEPMLKSWVQFSAATSKSWRPPGVQVGFDGRDRPVAVAVEHVAAVAFVEQGGVEADVVIGG